MTALRSLAMLMFFAALRSALEEDVSPTVKAISCAVLITYIRTPMIVRKPAEIPRLLARLVGLFEKTAGLVLMLSAGGTAQLVLCREENTQRQ